MPPVQRAIVCWLLLSSSSWTQSTKSEIFGTVRDPRGMAVEGAAVELVNTATGASLALRSARDGTYRFLAVPAGVYRITAARDGFALLRRDGIAVPVAGHMSVDLELSLGSLSQSIEITAAPPLLRSSRATVTMVVEQEKVVSLPLDGRNFIPLIALSPGVNLPPGNLLPRINGGRPRVSEYLYDGVSVLQPEPGQAAFYPIVDAIHEFRVETNAPAAEYGRFNGGVIMVNLKSGSNSLRGSLFEFLRNEKLNARNLFATAVDKPRFRRNQYGFVLGGPVQKNKTFFFLDWQGTRLDNGVVRISTVPTTAQRHGVFSEPIFNPFSTRRTESGYARDPFPDNSIPAALIDPAAAAVAIRYPAPNVYLGNAEATANNYRRVGSDTTAQDQFDIRLDRHTGARHKIFGRYSYLGDNSAPATPLPDGSGNYNAPFIGQTSTRAGSVVAEHTWSLTAPSVNQLRFGYTRRGFTRTSLATGRPATEAAQIPNLPLTSFRDVLPSYDIAGLQQLGPPPNSNARFTTSVTQFIDNYSWAKAAHSIKLGADIRLQRLDVLQPPSPTGNFQFTSIFTAGLSAAGTPATNSGHSFASFLTGPVTRFNIDAQAEALGPRATLAEFFLQHDWRATPKLTINSGVRYTLNFPSTVAGNRGAVFDLDSQQLNYLGQRGFPRSARNLEKANFGPRLGIAFRLTNSSAIRAAYSLAWIEQAGITTPFTTPLFPFVQSLTQQTFDNINPAMFLSRGPSVFPQAPGPEAGLGQGVFAVQRDNGSGYAQQWNLSLQKTFGGDWSMETGYLASKLTRLGVPDVNLNQLTVEQLGSGAQLIEQVPNPFFGQIPPSTSLGAPAIPRAQLLRPYPRFTTVALYRNNIGHSTYHSLQSRLEKRFSRGLTFSMAYTFSRLIDDAGAVFDAAVLTGPVTNFQAADSFNRRLEKDVSTGNMPHILSSGAVYELPFGRGRARRLRGWRDAIAGGWQLAGLLRLQSGTPAAVTQATNFNAFAGFGIQRPNRLGDPRLDASERSTARYFNTDMFTPAPQFTIGNSSRNPVTGPPYRVADVMAGKTFALTERLRAELRAEAFNVTNTPPLGNPNGSFGHAAFGSITSAFDPRVFELVLKIHF